MQLRQGNPETNSFCIGLLVIDRTASEPPRLLDVGGDLPLVVVNSRSFGLFDTGYVMPTTPRWSPDGESLAFLKRVAGSTQIYTVGLEGGSAIRLTDAPSDIDDMAWSGPRTVIYKTKADGEAAQEAIDREGLSGWNYDARFYPVQQSRPYPPHVRDSYFAIDLSSGVTRPASDQEQALLDPRAAFGANWNLETRTRSRTGTASIEPLDPGAFWSQNTIRYVDDAGNPGTCASPTCSGRLEGLWPRPDGSGFLFTRRQGHGEGLLGVYSWAPDEGAPRQLLETEDILLGCQSVREGLLCAHESPSRPRDLVLINANTGAVESIFDPNPEFSSLHLGTVSRLEWNGVDREAYGYLVLPPNHQPGDQHPLIVVGYETRGFLRGGTGDEHPIFALAARGFAVLTYQAGMIARPPSASLAEYQRADTENWASRRSMLSVISAGVSEAADLGVVTRGQVGITGFSEGAAYAIYAMINAPGLFNAASLTPCCSSPSFISLMGPGLGNTNLIGKGWPELTKPDPAFWAPMSLTQNAGRVDTPILVQVADREYLLGVDVHQVRRETNQPFDMYVFPDEYHYKHQPAHRLAIYQRNIDWFDFWLRNRRSSDPSRAAELDRWDAMRAAQPTTAAAD